MGRTPCCTKVGLIRGPWTSEEDLRLSNYIQTHGEGSWRTLPRKAGLLRCGKSCRLRWMNYLRPDVKRGHITPEEEDLILRLHRLLGNRWSLIAGRIPGRTDNDIKNYWNTQLSKKLINQGIDPRTHKPLSETLDVYVNSDNSDVSPKFLEQDLPSSTYLPGPRLPVPDHKEDEFVLCPPNGKVIENGFNQIAVYDHVSLDTSFLKGHVSCINKSIPPPDISPELISTPYTMHGEFTPSLKNSENNQFCSAPLMLTTVSSAAGDHETYNDYFMNKNVMSSHDIKSFIPQTPAFIGQQNLAHVSVSSNISFAKQFFQGSEMELQNCDIQVPPLATVYNKSSNTNWTAPSLSSSHAAPMSDVEPAFGDYSSDMFSSMLESFANEEMHLQNSQLCLNQPEPAHLPHDLWSLLYPIAGDDSSRSLY